MNNSFQCVIDAIVIPNKFATQKNISSALLKSLKCCLLK